MSISRAGEILAHEILYAYPQGLFPMSRHRDSMEYAWYRPEERGIIPIDGFHISRSLARFARQNQDDLSFAYDLDFAAVIDACADREETWISPVIRDAFLRLHQNQLAHSFEVRLSGALIGGVYGLALGGAFFGESMFSRATNGSKLALGALVNDLKPRGFQLFDTQYLTDHLASLGAIEISNSEYQARLAKAIRVAPVAIVRGEIDGIKYF